jgi:CheY-like chemotaxis protein
VCEYISGGIKVPAYRCCRTRGHTLATLRHNEPFGAVSRVTAQEGTAKGTGPAQETRMMKVLLVEDHNLFRQVLALTLKYRTDFRENVQARSVAEASQIVADSNDRVDLAIVDLDLPGWGTTELIQNLHDLGVPVLALTNIRSPEERTRAVQAGANEVLSMASSDKEFIRVVNRLVSE